MTSERNYGIFTVSERQRRGPHGKSARFVIVDAPDWAIVVPVLSGESGRMFLCVSQYRHGSESVCMEFPGGVVEPGEDPAAAARRELLEETGYEAVRLIKLGSCSPNPAFMNNTLHIFLAENPVKLRGQDLDEHEFVDVSLIGEDIVLADQGDALWSHALMSCAALFYVRYRRNSGE